MCLGSRKILTLSYPRNLLTGNAQVDHRKHVISIYIDHRGGPFESLQGVCNGTFPRSSNTPHVYTYPFRWIHLLTVNTNFNVVAPLIDSIVLTVAEQGVFITFVKESQILSPTFSHNYI